MKQFILENIYMSDMSAPSVCSSDLFPTFESAMEEAHKQFKEEAKTYRASSFWTRTSLPLIHKEVYYDR